MAKKSKPVKRILTPEAFEALKAVVGYCWADEERDYHDQLDMDDVEGHVFEHLKLLNEQLGLGF